MKEGDGGISFFATFAGCFYGFIRTHLYLSDLVCDQCFVQYMQFLLPAYHIMYRNSNLAQLAINR